MTYVDHFVSQFAGELGFISVGLGKEFSRYSVAALYGVVPPELSGGPVIETVTLRQTYHFFHWKKIDQYGGLNIFHALGGHYESSTYGDPPDDYYSIGSIRGLVYLGLSYNLGKNEKNYFFVESGMNDLGIVNWGTNFDEVNPVNYISLALGYKRRF